MSAGQQHEVVFRQAPLKTADVLPGELVEENRFLLIRGPPGSGRTTLARTVPRALWGRYGSLCNEPYSAILHAVSTYVRQEGDERIRQAVGDEGVAVLSTMIPVLADGTSTKVTLEDCGQRFAYVLRLCLRATDRPLILDDVDYADPASLDLFTTILTDVESHFCVVGVCRDGDLPESLTSRLRDMAEHHVPMAEVPLKERTERTMGRWSREQLLELSSDDLELLQTAACLGVYPSLRLL